MHARVDDCLARRAIWVVLVVDSLEPVYSREIVGVAINKGSSLLELGKEGAGAFLAVGKGVALVIVEGCGLYKGGALVGQPERKVGVAPVMREEPKRLTLRLPKGNPPPRKGLLRLGKRQVIPKAGLLLKGNPRRRTKHPENGSLTHWDTRGARADIDAVWGHPL